MIGCELLQRCSSKREVYDITGLNVVGLELPIDDEFQQKILFKRRGTKSDATGATRQARSHLTRVCEACVFQIPYSFTLNW